MCACIYYSGFITSFAYIWTKKFCTLPLMRARICIYIYSICHLRPDRFSGLYFFFPPFPFPYPLRPGRFRVYRSRGSARSAAHGDHRRNPQRNWFPPDDYPSVDIWSIHHIHIYSGCGGCRVFFFSLSEFPFSPLYLFHSRRT